jgi:hypothetical protein
MQGRTWTLEQHAQRFGAQYRAQSIRHVSDQCMVDLVLGRTTHIETLFAPHETSAHDALFQEFSLIRREKMTVAILVFPAKRQPTILLES